MRHVCWTKPRDPQVKLVSSLLRTLRVDQENVPVVRVMSCKLHQTIDLPHQVGQIHSNSHDPPQLLVLKRAQAQLMVLSQSTTSYIGTQHSPHPPLLLQHKDIVVKYRINDEIQLALTKLHPHHHSTTSTVHHNHAVKSLFSAQAVTPAGSHSHTFTTKGAASHLAKI